jgi:hypothetical protein
MALEWKGGGLLSFSFGGNRAGGVRGECCLVLACWRQPKARMKKDGKPPTAFAIMSIRGRIASLPKPTRIGSPFVMLACIPAAAAALGGARRVQRLLGRVRREGLPDPQPGLHAHSGVRVPRGRACASLLGVGGCGLQRRGR